MTYEVIITKSALKGLKFLQKGTRKKIMELLVYLKEHPIPAHRYDVKKLKGTENTYRIRIGKYRVIYGIEGETVQILAVSHRKSAYKR